MRSSFSLLHPVFLILILWVFYHKKPDKKAVITCFIALLGIICFFFDKITSGGTIGNVLAIISGLSYAIMFQMKQMKGGDFESSLVISYILAFLIGLPASVHETVHTPAVWLVIILLGVVQTGLATICLSRGLDAVPPVTAALTSGIEPILNPVLLPSSAVKPLVLCPWQGAFSLSVLFWATVSARSNSPLFPAK